ncbi:MAG: hypothetical protein IJ416_04650 [Ruminiclostridium sp.]|nr:hypothetical protein [Ruminiclostridium sp.]
MENRRKISFKKPVIAVCAAVAALSLGVTGAAAAGIIDFNEIFGSRLRVENEELGSSLIGKAADVKWTTSDEDYVVNLKGVTGSGESAIVVIEIARADGTPVEDYFRNTDLLSKTNLMGAYSDCRIDGEYPDIGRGYNEYVNENGNIEISVEFSGIHHSYNMKGRKISLAGTGFYPAYNLIEGEVPREKTAFMADGCSEYQLTQEEWDYLDSIAVLDLDWSIEFVYNPSEKSTDKLVAKELSEKTLMAVDVDIMHENSDGTLSFENYEIRELEAAFDEITISSVGGMLSGNIDISELVAESYYPSVLSRSDTNVKLFNRDGTESDIMVFMSSGTSNTNRETGILSFSFEIEFHANGGQTAVDLSEIGAISINGTVYNLE